METVCLIFIYSEYIYSTSTVAEIKFISWTASFSLSISKYILLDRPVLQALRKYVGLLFTTTHTIHTNCYRLPKHSPQNPPPSKSFKPIEILNSINFVQVTTRFFSGINCILKTYFAWIWHYQFKDPQCLLFSGCCCLLIFLYHW